MKEDKSKSKDSKKPDQNQYEEKIKVKTDFEDTIRALLGKSEKKEKK